MSPTDVVVIGGGVIGLSIAWRLAQRDRQVTVVDPSPGSGASYAAAGMLAPVTEVHYEEEALLALNLESARRYPAFCAELETLTGIPTGYRECGTLAVAADNGDNAWLGDLFRFQTELGLEVDRLSSRQCRDLEPGLSPTVRGGIRVRGDHQVDPRRLVEALLAACRRTGVTLCTGRVEVLLHRSGHCYGVALAPAGAAGAAGAPGAPTLLAPTVILAAGAWSSRLGEHSDLPPDALPPIRPVKGQILRLRHRTRSRLLEGTVRGLVAGSGVYLVPRDDGEVVVGATMEEQGFDAAVTAGAVHDLLRDAYALVPGITELELTECHAALRPCSPDNAPMIGDSTLPGLILATGHCRNGVLLAPVTAELIAGLVVDAELPASAQAFDPARFSGSAA